MHVYVQVIIDQLVVTISIPNSRREFSPRVVLILVQVGFNSQAYNKTTPSACQPAVMDNKCLVAEGGNLGLSWFIVAQ